ncbi:MAG: PfkB family carbohydrate kinase [Treponema sp.]|jgi:sugar/nucleoside kinase (ribokinase family)|nr:PfkB family carbohydrate kinase [Treponema sp.]
MKQTLVIGSSVMDVILNISHLPRRGEDINLVSSAYRLGGCAYNVYKTLGRFESSARLCSPVGSGVYGRMVRECFAQEGIVPLVELDEENGCCYCLVELDGERTFLSHHGAEYRFSRSWMNGVDHAGVDSIFICGIDVEDPTGNEIVSYVCEHPELELYFAPGPRIMYIAPDRMEAILDRRPVLHLNEAEARSYAGYITAIAGKAGAPPAAGPVPDVEEAAAILSEQTGNTVVITLGKQGCYYHGGPHNPGPDRGLVPGFPATVINTIGAGDAHCGALMASLKEGKDLRKACETANRTGAAVVSREA